MVVTHTNNPEYGRQGRSTRKVSIDWTAISKLMQRAYMECKAKWNLIRAATMKKGPYTAEEDSVIMQRVAAFGDQKVIGMWVGIAKDLDRPAHSVRCRWRILRRKAE